VIGGRVQQVPKAERTQDCGALFFSGASYASVFFSTAYFVPHRKPGFLPLSSHPARQDPNTQHYYTTPRSTPFGPLLPCKKIAGAELASAGSALQSQDYQLYYNQKARVMLEFTQEKKSSSFSVGTSKHSCSRLSGELPTSRMMKGHQILSDS